MYYVLHSNFLRRPFWWNSRRCYQVLCAASKPSWSDEKKRSKRGQGLLARGWRLNRATRAKSSMCERGNCSQHSNPRGTHAMAFFVFCSLLFFSHLVAASTADQDVPWKCHKSISLFSAWVFYFDYIDRITSLCN